MGLADDMPGIQERKDRLIKKLRTRFSRLDWNLLFSEAPALGSEESAVMSWFAKHQMHMNAHEVKNVFDHYAVDAVATVGFFQHARTRTAVDAPVAAEWV